MGAEVMVYHDKKFEVNKIANDGVASGSIRLASTLQHAWPQGAQVLTKEAHGREFTKFSHESDGGEEGMGDEQLGKSFAKRRPEPVVDDTEMLKTISGINDMIKSEIESIPLAGTPAEEGLAEAAKAKGVENEGIA